MTIRKNRLLIYVPVPARCASTPIDKSAWQSFKSLLVRNYEMEVSVRTGKFHLTDYHHANTHSSNRGDVAIGKAVESSWASALGSEHCDITVIGWDELNVESVRWINDNFDIFVIGGGGYIFLDASGKLNRRKEDLEFIKLIKIPVVAHGIGLNRLMHESQIEEESFESLPSDTLEYVRSLSKAISVISVRDVPSKKLFEAAGRSDVYVTGDPALFWNPVSSTQSDLKYFSRQNVNIGVNVAAHGWRALKILEEVMPDFESLFQSLSQGADCKLHYFLHEDLEYSVVKYLARRGVNFQLIDGSLEVMYDSYRSMNYVISEMLHSSIMAFAVDTPCVNIAYDRKSSAFYDLFGLSEYSIPWDKLSLDRISSAVDSLRNSLPEVRHVISKRRGELHSVENMFLKTAITLI